MKVSELFESDDDKMKRFQQGLGARIRARVASDAAMHDAMFKDHKWLYDVGDTIMSHQTGMVYTITAKSSRMWAPSMDENGRIYRKGEAPAKKLVPIYYYKAGDEEGTFIEPLFKPGMFTLISKGKGSPNKD